MKRRIVALMIAICSLGLISWGVTGHRAVAKIAENHLTPKTQAAVKDLLRGATLPDVSNWADEIRSNPEFKYTGPWHYADVPAGLTFEQFATEIKNMHDDNVYKMVIRCELDLESASTSKDKKATALKFLVHFVGDLHQPMHVAHPDDRGGNKITVRFFNSDENLHGLWDSGIFDHQGLSYQKMATTYDTATPEQIKKWQSDSIMIWLWESYQISSILYQEAADDPKFGEEYYQSHLEIIQLRIEKAGIRLAGILNRIFDKGN